MTLLNRWAMVALVTAGFGAAMHERPRPTHVMSTKMECPHYWSADSGGPLQIKDSIPIAGPTTNIPEYNDCQRFLESNGPGQTLHYGAIQAVWIRYNIAAVMQFPHPVGQTGAFHPRIASITAASNIAVVGIVYSMGPSDDLGILPGWDCIVLKYDRVDAVVLPTTYEAWMVPVEKAAQCEGNPKDFDPARATPLTVTSNPAIGNDTVPEVARWHWDPRKQKQFVGLWCPTGWCEMHKTALAITPESPYGIPAGMNKLHSVIRQKGWYDDQILMAPPPASGATVPGEPVPSMVRGTVFPAPNLASRTVSHYRGKWQPVAWVSLDRPSNEYKARYMYERDAAPPNGIADNVVSMCFEGDGAREKARITGDARGVCRGAVPTGCRQDATNKGQWYLEIQSPAGMKRYCVMYRPAPAGVKLPGAVRWRWSAKDETIWISCPTGCCEGDSIGP